MQKLGLRYCPSFAELQNLRYRFLLEGKFQAAGERGVFHADESTAGLVLRGDVLGAEVGDAFTVHHLEPEIFGRCRIVVAKGDEERFLAGVVQKNLDGAGDGRTVPCLGLHQSAAGGCDPDPLGGDEERVARSVVLETEVEAIDALLVGKRCLVRGEGSIGSSRYQDIFGQGVMVFLFDGPVGLTRMVGIVLQQKPAHLPGVIPILTGSEQGEFCRPGRDAGRGDGAGEGGLVGIRGVWRRQSRRPGRCQHDGQQHTDEKRVKKFG